MNADLPAGRTLIEHPARGRLGVGPVGFGCGPNAGLMVGADDDARRRVVAAAVASGIGFFDTAMAYGDGASERNLGRILAELGADVPVFTKVLVGPGELDRPGAAVLRSIAESRRRTGRRHFAGVTLHNRLAVRRDADRAVGIGPVLTPAEVLGPGGVADALDELRARGEVGLAGLTTLGGDLQAIRAAMASGRFDFVNALYGLLGPLDRGMPPIAGAPQGHDVIVEAAASGLDVIALRVLGGGLLLDPQPEQREAVARLRRWAEARGETVTHLALRYALSRPEISAVVIGFTEPAHVAEAVAAVHDGPLPDVEIAELVRLRAGAAHASGAPQA